MRLLDWLHRRRDPIDQLIAQNRARVKFHGFDPALRERTDAKRQEAERLAKASRRVASAPVTERSLRRIR